MSANPFDQACRSLAKLDPASFIAWLLRLQTRDFRFRRWLDARQVRFPGEPDRTCDTVAFLEDLAQGGLPWALPVEFQIEPDALMFGRLLGYLGTLWLQERPSPERGDRFQVGAVVVNLTGMGNASRQMAWPQAGLLTHLGVVERDLAGYDALETLGAIREGRAPAVSLPLIPLMRGGAEVGIMPGWLELASAEPDARRRADLGGLALVFAEAGKCHAAWHKALEGWNMIQSKQVLEWQAQAKNETLLEVLETRFGTLPPDLITAIHRVMDMVRLKTLVQQAVRAIALEQFRQDTGL